MSDTLIPPAGSEAAATLRSGFSVTAVETALAALDALAATGLTFHAGPLPDETNGVGVTVRELPEPEEPSLGRFRALAVFAGRSADAEFPARFSRLAALFPAEEVEAGAIRFSALNQKGACRIEETIHHGIRKWTATLELLCEIDLTQSTFPGISTDTDAATPEQWAALRPAAVEAALASHLGIDAGALPDDDSGTAIRVTGGAVLADAEWRDFSFELAVRALGNSEAKETLAALLAGFPKENFSAGGITFNGVWQESATEFRAGSLFDRSSVLAEARLTARVNAAASQGAGSVLPEAAPNRSVTAFDPAALERALASRIADALGLVLDRELCRGEFPPPGSGVAPVATVRLLGITSGNRETGWRIQAQLQLRAPHRDELFQRILNFDALFPRYGETLGGFTLRAMLKSDFTLGWKEKNGRNMMAASLSLELVL